jgi:hypothetical protein
MSDRRKDYGPAGRAERGASLVMLVAVLLVVLAGCGPAADEITEIETGENGVKVETWDDREWYLRRGIDCDEGERLWECADRGDLLVEQRAPGGRAGGGIDA